MKAKKRIVHPTDFSAAAEPAFRYAIEYAQEFTEREGAELILVHVIEPIAAFGEELYVERSRDLQHAAETAARRGFDRLLARAKAAGVAATDVLLHGWPPEEIVNIAADRGADLIVMGTHGRTGLRRILIGSVAQQVLALAPCPVVTVPMK
ncbi:MAG: universal stress protein [Candidatus Rokubacteria bacterium]|nr:universal stress protein [Candidatus Rokubacteria bacterium]